MSFHLPRRHLISGAAALAGAAALDALPWRTAEAASLPPFNLRRAQNLAKLDNRLLKRPVGSGFTTYNSGFTYATLWAIEAPFDYVRFHYVNSGTAAVPVIGNFAVSSQAGDGFTPVGGTLANITFNAGGAEGPPGFPPGTSGPTTSFSLPAAAASTSPTYSASDWMPVSSLEPTDGSLYWLMCRTYLSAAGYVGSSIPGGFAAYKTALGARATRNFTKAVDGVTTPANFTAANENGFIVPTLVEVMARPQGASIMGIGNSITAGAGSLSGVNGWGGIACAQISKPGLPVQWINGGWPGLASSLYYGLGKSQIDAFNPKVVCIEPFTPNDTGPTQAGIDAGWRDAIALAEYAAAKGAVPIFWTPVPWAYAPAAEALRQQICSRVRALGTAGVLVMDFDAAIRDPNSTATALAALIAGSGNNHPNDAGNAAMAVVGAPVLQQALGLL